MRNLKITAILLFLLGSFLFLSSGSLTRAAIAPPPIVPTTPKPNATPFNYPKPKTCYRCNPGGWCEAYTDTSPASNCSTGCGGCQAPPSRPGGTFPGVNPGPTPAPTPPPCLGSCYILSCSYTGRQGASGQCSFGQNCCSTGQVIPVCAVGGDVCGDKYGSRCCSGYSCVNNVCEGTGISSNPDIVPYAAVGCLHEGDCAINNTLCHVVNGGLLPDGGPCKPGTSPGSALVSNGAACSLAGGVCIATRSCASVGLSVVNGGSGCDSASSICCSRQQINQILTSTPPPLNTIASSICVSDSLEVVNGIKCCANTSFQFNGKNWCGTAPKNIYEIIPGQICDPYYGGGSGVCSCDGKIVGVGRMCLIGFDGIVRKSVNGGYEVYICDKNGQNCTWVNINNVNDPSFRTAFQKTLLSDPLKYLSFLSSSADLQGTYIYLCDANGNQTGTIQLGLGEGADPRRVADLIKSGQVCSKSISEIFSYADKQYSAQSQADILFGNSNLSQSQVDMIKEAQTKATDPISVQFERLSLQTLSIGLKSWIRRQEAILKDPSLPFWQKYLLLQYQSADLVTFGLLGSTTDASVAWAQCNALANAGLKPEGCGAETIAAGIQGTFLADLALSPFREAIISFFSKPAQSVVAGAKTYAELLDLAAKDASVRNYLNDLESQGLTLRLVNGKWEEVPVSVIVNPELQSRVYAYQPGETLFDQAGNPITSVTKLGSGAYADTYVDSTTGTVVKVFKNTTLQSEVAIQSAENEIKFYQQFGGQAGIPNFEGFVYDATGNIIGYKQSYIAGKTLADYVTAGGKFTQDQINQAVSELQQIQTVTGRAHGDIAVSGQIVNPDNIIVGSDGKIYFIDFSGFDPQGLATSGVKADELTSLQKGLQLYAK
ncbi:MAG: hypothetical protein HY044_04925 [Candidatus Woesebacteria bacterium]|nr:MAG: hypothetical protein HY044_04925 [Candidatus Woesebacteria bacterium]